MKRSDIIIIFLSYKTLAHIKDGYRQVETLRFRAYIRFIDANRKEARPVELSFLLHVCSICFFFKTLIN